MQDKTTLLETTSAGTGLKINIKKTELMKMNTTANAPVTVGGEPIREVESFIYLGSVADQQGGTDRDVTARIGKARAAFVMLKNFWASGEISMRTKLRIFKTSVKSFLLYGCDMADNIDEATKDSDILQHLSEAHLQNPVAAENAKICGSERDRNHGQEDTAEEVGLDRTHSQEASIKHHTPSPDLEPAREEKERPASQQLEARH